MGHPLDNPERRSIRFGERPLRFRAKLSGAGAFEVYLWTGGTLLSEFELSGGEKGMVGGAEPAVDLTRVIRRPLGTRFFEGRDGPEIRRGEGMPRMQG